MWRALTVFIVIAMSVRILVTAEAPLADNFKFDVGNGVIATSDGRSGPIMLQNMQVIKDDLSDIADRTQDVIYGRKYGTVLTIDVYQPKTKGTVLALSISSARDCGLARSIDE